MSLRARLLAASLALVALGLIAANVFTYRALRSSLQGRVDDQLDAAQTAIQRSILFRGDEVQSVTQLSELVPGVFVQIRVGNRTVLQTTVRQAGSGESLSAPVLPEALEVGEFTTVPSSNRSEAGFRLLVSQVDRAAVIIGIPLDSTSETLRRLLAIEIVVSLIVFAGAAGVGFWLVRLGLRPLADIEATAAAVTSGDMSGRVPASVAEPSTEVGRLGQALNVMLDSVDSALGEAVSSEERMRRFVADASHELRTPVAAVRGYAELYRRGADSRPEDLARLLSRIELEAERMGVLVDDLLLLTRLDEGRPLASEAVDLGAVAADAVAAARAVDPARSVALVVDGSVEVRGDRGRLRQVLDNLLANVRAHTPAGAPASVRVFVDSASGAAVVEVADSGPGLTADDLARVFERFYRGDPSRARDADAGGSGLGLSIASAIVEAHGGSVTAANRPDFQPGAVFRVTLPAFSPAGGAGENAPAG